MMRKITKVRSVLRRYIVLLSMLTALRLFQLKKNREGNNVRVWLITFMTHCDFNSCFF